MKTLTALMFLAIAAHAKMIVAPDGRFELEIGSNSIVLADARTSTPIMPLAIGTAQDESIDAVWSPDSTRVVVVENTARGSDVIAAFFKDGQWHKTAESDRPGANFIRRIEKQIGAHIVKEQREIAGWIDADSAQIKGTLKFSNGETAAYSYTDSFASGPTRTSPAGYEIGAIKSGDYQTQ